MKVKVTQLCPTLCDPMDCSPPGSSVRGILQAKTLEWVVIPFSRGSSWPRDWTQVSCIAGRFFISWATREVPKLLSVSSVQSLSRVWLFATPWITARQASLSITSSRSSLRLMSIESVMPSSHSSSVVPFSSCPQSLPASESFPMSQLFTWDGQSTGVSALASFIPKNTQGWSPLEWTGWISLQSKGLSRVFSNTTVQNINSSALSFLHSPTHISIYDH